ncbi:protein FAM228B isoform X2 [Apus apus]|uniref:protein FAM228B isoform X2 n=1 Tax=Apus apus TaxID=8895 RepID=UPI0021F88C3B|nr:protein FAM228B isoform X2 [Apus apus]
MRAPGSPFGLAAAGRRAAGRAGAGRARVAPQKGFTASLAQKKKTAQSGRKCAADGLKQEPVSSLQAAPAESQDVIAAAQCILDREYQFGREVERYLRHNDFLNLRKKELLYKKWLENVSEPLLQRIMEKMDSQSSEEIRKRKEEQLSLYLNYCNKTKVSIPALQDPLLKSIQRKFTETGVIKQCETGRPCSSRELRNLLELPLLPLSRQRLDAAEWLKIPHAYIASEVRHTKRQKVTGHHKDGKSQECHLPFS